MNEQRLWTVKGIIRHIFFLKTILYSSYKQKKMKHMLTATSTCSPARRWKMTLEEEEAITLPLYRLELKTGVSYQSDSYAGRNFEPPVLKLPFYINVTNEGIVLWRRYLDEEESRKALMINYRMLACLWDNERSQNSWFRHFVLP